MSENYAGQSERDQVIAGTNVGATSTSGSQQTGDTGMEDIRPLVTGLGRDMSELIREQVRLAQTELRDEAKEAGRGAAEIGAGGIAALVGFTFLVQGVAEFLSKRLPRWASFGLVGLGLAAAAGALGTSGKERLNGSKLKPQQTIASLKETQRWLRRETNRA